MLGLGVVKKGVKAVAVGGSQQQLGVQSPHLAAGVTRLGRFAFVFTGTWIGVSWYTAYANVHTDPTTGTGWLSGRGPRLVLPGITGAKLSNPPSRGDPPLPSWGKNGTGTSTATSQLPASATGGVPASGHLTAQQLGGFPPVQAKVSAIAATIMTKFPRMKVTSTFRPGGQSYHARHQAVDMAGPAMDSIGTWIGQNFTTQLLEGIHNPTLSVKNGKTVPPSLWGPTTWAAHVNHIHVAA